MKSELKLFVNLLLIILLFYFSPLIFAQEETSLLKEETLQGQVVRVVEEKEIEEGEGKEIYQKLEVQVTGGSLKGKKIIIDTQQKLSKAGQTKYKKGDEVFLSYTKDLENKDLFYITDYVRKYSLFWLLVIFIVLVLLVGRWQGLSSLLGMGVSFFIIIKLILPQILASHDPILVVILGSLFIVPITFYLSHGINRKTTVAIFSTLISLLITGLLAKAFIEASKLTGFASEEATFLKIAKGEVINIKGLLLAGIIISSLGVLDDITISQAALVEQLKQADSQILPDELFKRAMSVGQDHIASMVNTLILVYTGAALPLLLLFVNNPHPFSEIVSYEIVAEEVVRSLVSSIGLVLAVPLTTFLAARFHFKK